MAGTLAAIGSLVGAGTSLYSATKGGGPSGGARPAYQPTGQGAADTQWQQWLQSLAGPLSTEVNSAAQMLPIGYNDLLKIPTGGLNQAGAVAGQADQNAANLAGSNMNSMVNLAGGQNALANWINNQGMSLWNTAQDPQQALQNRLMQQVQDAARANSSAAGLGTSGAGVGTQNQAMSDFLINWQNQQLGRQIAGMGGLNQALGVGQRFQDNVGQDLAAAQQYASAIPGYQMASATDPYNMNVMAAMLPFMAQNAYGSGLTNNVIGPTNAAMGNVIPYLNQGLGAQQVAYNQGQTNLNNLTTGISQLTNPSVWSTLAKAFDTAPTTNYDPTGSGAYYGQNALGGTYGPL